MYPEGCSAIHEERLDHLVLNDEVERRCIRSASMFASRRFDDLNASNRTRRCRARREMKEKGATMIRRVGQHRRSSQRGYRSVALAVFLAIGLTAGVALADSPHFIGTPSGSVSGNSLTVTFKAAGLGNGPYAAFTLEGSVDVFSRCYNRGGNKPQADNKQETISVNETKDFPVSHGQTTGSFTVTPLSTLTCPGNQVVVIESVSFDLLLTGPGGITANITS